jgi:RimJ/RimL family protein N-acetyltransferase
MVHVIYAGEPLKLGEVSLQPVDPEQVHACPVDGTAAASMGWVNRAETDESMLYFGICRRHQLVGQIFLHDMDCARRETLVGYHLFTAAARRERIGTHALRLLQRYVITCTSLVRAIVITSVDNTASQKLAQRCDFVLCGAPRENPAGLLYEWTVPAPPTRPH